MLAVTLFTTSCNSIEDTPANVSRLQVSVTNTQPQSRAIVTGTTLPAESAIGVTLLDVAGQNYDDVPYANLQYKTANGTDWAVVAPDEVPLLSSTDGKAIAYHPYKSGADYTALDVETASQTDYMYSSWVTGINNFAPQANFTMKHGLSAFRVVLKKDENYKVDATAKTVTIQSDAFVASAKMSAVDGTLSAWTGDGNVSVTLPNSGIALSTSEQSHDIMVVPAQAAGTEATFTVAVADENDVVKNYTVGVPFTSAMQQGKVYQFSLTLSATGFSVSTVAVTEWGTPIVVGDDNTLQPKLPVVGTIDLTTADNGVYAVAQNRKGVTVADADESCIAVALITDNQKIMIEKNGEANTAWNGETYLYWGENLYGYNVSGITDITTGYGVLGSDLSTDYTTWTSGALSDFKGKDNTAAIIEAYTEHSVSMVQKDMCSVLQTFNEENDEDWYIPACGQLALMYLNMTSINEALTAIGGKVLASDYYWSSSESNDNYAWNVDFNTGRVTTTYENFYRRVRFVQDIK